MSESDITTRFNGVSPPEKALDESSGSGRTVNPFEFDDNVTVSIKPPSALNIEIDLDRFTIGDMEFVGKLANDEPSLEEMIEFIRRVVPDVDSIPMRAVSKIVDAIIGAVGGASDPNG